MSAHTPGPWAITTTPPNQYWLAGRSIGAADPNDARRVCDVFSHMTPPEPGSMAEANARLIAAAPEMLKALQDVIAWFDAESNHEGTTFWERVEMCNQVEKDIRAILAKATGAAA